MDAVETYLRDRFGNIQLRPPASFSGTNQIRVAKIAGLEPDDILNEFHHFPETARQRCQSFLEGYEEQHPLTFSADLLRDYCIYRIWIILLRAGGVPDRVKAEWVRRLRWALQNEFMT